jgi:anti-sigma regulatory factor (Ser/Thr protein kinase)
MEQVFDARGLYELRSALAAHASALGVVDEHVERLVIVAGELATNAIRHGGGTGRVRLWHDNASLYCRVSDDGPGMPDTNAGSVMPESTAVSGRGLWICSSLARELIIEHGPQRRGLSVTAIIAVAYRPTSAMD